LRKWFAHDPDKWADFKRRYVAELQDQSEALSQLRTHMRQGRVPLLYGAKDEAHNNAVVLRTLLKGD
jgi:uncharacterized protein YeaO (DUF488 family)